MFDFLCDLPTHEVGKLLEAERRDDDRGTATTEDPYERFLQMLPDYRVPWTLTTPFGDADHLVTLGGLTPLQIAVKLGHRGMTRAVLRRHSEIRWRWGELSEHRIYLHEMTVMPATIR